MQKEGDLEGRMAAAAPSPTAAPRSHNAEPRRLRCRAASTLPTATVRCSRFQWILSTFLLLHMTPPSPNPPSPPLPLGLPFMRPFAVYGYTEIPLCRHHTLFRKVSPAQCGGESVSVLYIAPPSPPPSLTLLIRLLYMFTYTTAKRMIMSLAHVVEPPPHPPRRINNIPSVYVTPLRGALNNANIIFPMRLACLPIVSADANFIPFLFRTAVISG